MRGYGAVVACVGFLAGPATAQHLYWERVPADSTCVYGEITVLVTHPGTYYCGANWHPGRPAGGYCGIQHNRVQERRTIFSIWDTADKLRPEVVYKHTETVGERFGGEGEGAHTHMVRDWRVGETFRFLVRKQPGPKADTTDADYFIADAQAGKWLHSATIRSPNGDAKSAASVTTVGSLQSFLENFTGKDRATARVALYRLWAGTDPGDLKCLTHAEGDGVHGRLHDAYFLADGGKDELAAAWASLRKEYGEPEFGTKGKPLLALADRPLSDERKTELKAVTRPAR